MKKIAKTKPLDFAGQGFQEKIINFEPDNALDRINYSKCYHNCQASGYQQLINFVINGDVISAREFIEKAGFSGILADFLLDNAEIDAMLEIAANFAACGVCDE